MPTPMRFRSRLRHRYLTTPPSIASHVVHRTVPPLILTSFGVLQLPAEGRLPTCL